MTCTGMEWSIYGRMELFGVECGCQGDALGYVYKFDGASAMEFCEATTGLITWIKY